MANNCNNYLYISSISEDNLKRLSDFFDKVKHQGRHSAMLSFYKVAVELSHRDEFKDFDLTSEEAFWKETFDVYDLFGSKWFEFEYEEDETISGDSAWSPMLPFFQILADEFDFCCDGNYEESGNIIYGTFSIDDGNFCDTSMGKWEYIIKKADPFPEIEYYLEDGMLDSNDMKEIESYMTQDDFKEVCDMITTSEQESIDNKEEREEWLILKPKED